MLTRRTRIKTPSFAKRDCILVWCFSSLIFFHSTLQLENVPLAERLLAQETPEFKKDKKAILARTDEAWKGAS